MAQIASCPDCHKNLQVPDDLIGKNVQCPGCKNEFVAQPATGVSSQPTSGRTSNSSVPTPRPRRPLEDDDSRDDDDAPRRPRRFRPSYEPHRGGLVLTLGIVSLVLPCIGIVLGPMAWVMGNSDMREIRAGRMDPEGEGMTQAGRVLGIVATILSIIAVLSICGYFLVVFLMFGVLFGAAAAGAAKQNQFNNRRGF